MFVFFKHESFRIPTSGRGSGQQFGGPSRTIGVSHRRSFFSPRAPRILRDGAKVQEQTSRNIQLMSSSSSTELPVIKLKRRISRVTVNAITELLQNKVKSWQNVSLYCDICDSLIAQLLCSPICSHGSLLFTPGIRFFSKFMQR